MELNKKEISKIFIINVLYDEFKGNITDKKIRAFIMDKNLSHILLKYFE